MTVWTETESPVGTLHLVGDGRAITHILFDPPAEPVGERADDHPLLREACAQLGAYFAGDLKDFDIPLAPVGTPFQQRVWQALPRIAYGTTSTYGEVARELGLPPGAARAVGLANGRNPVPVVVPCHRVVGTKGKLVGYAGGLDRKQWLLSLESGGLF